MTEALNTARRILERTGQHAVFCSGRHALFETVRLYEPARARVAIAPKPLLEPLVAAAG
jgi:hypothetical protein